MMSYRIRAAASACLCAVLVSVMSGCGKGDSGPASKANKKSSAKAKSKSDTDDSSLGDIFREKLRQAEASAKTPAKVEDQPEPVAVATATPMPANPTPKPPSAEKPSPASPPVATNSPEHPEPGKPVVDVQTTIIRSAWTRDGRKLLLTTLRGLLIVDVASGATQRPGPANVYQLALSPDEKSLALTTEDHTIQFWNFPDLGQTPRATTAAQKDLIPQISFSPDSSLLYSLCYGTATVQVWNCADGKLAKELPLGELKTQFMKLSNDGRLLALGGEVKEGEFNVHQEVQLWDLQSNKLRHKFATDFIPTAMAFSAEGGRLAVGAYIPSSVWLWETDSGKLIKEMKGHGSEIKCLEFIDHDRFLVSGAADKTIRVWDAATGDQKAVLEGPQDTVNSVTAGPKIPWLASVDRTKVRFWKNDELLNGAPKSNKTGDESKSLRAHEDGGLWHFDVSRDGKYLVSRNSETAKFWELETGKVITSIPCQSPGAPPVAISPDGKQFAITKHRAIELYSIPAGKLEQKLEHDEIYMPRRLMYTPDGKKFIAGTGKFALVWDAAKHQLLKAWEADDKDIESMAITPDSKQLITGHENGKLNFWDLETYKSVNSIQVSEQQITEIALSSDGALMATNSFDEPIKIWDLTSKPVNTDSVKLTKNLHAARIDGMVFIAETSLLAVPGVDDEHNLKDEYRNAVTIIDAKTGKVVKILKGHTDNVMSLRYLPQQKQLMSADQYSIKFWALDPKELTAPGN